MRKILLIFLLLTMSIFLFSLDVQHEELSEDLSMIVNEDEISSEVFKAKTGVVSLLSTIKNTNEDFFQTLTNTATGLDLLNTYNKRKALEFSGNVLFIQFVEEKGIELNRETLKESINSQFNNILNESELSEEDLSNYLGSKGYTSKKAYLDEQYYNALYEKAIQSYYEQKSKEYDITEEEIQKEYNENENLYVRPPQAEISIIRFSNSDEASLTYNKISQGYYSFEEVFEQKQSEGNSDNINIKLNVQQNEFIDEVKNNAPGYISKPQEISENEWILIKILKKSPEKELDLEEAKNQIIFNLRDKKAKDYFDKILPEEFEEFKNNSTLILNKSLFY
ncbi:MAG: peptidyl-prolyl cis-trans isomerase [Thermotogota bacterium]